jgi:hypothetical protein
VRAAAVALAAGVALLMPGSALAQTPGCPPPESLQPPHYSFVENDFGVAFNVHLVATHELIVLAEFSQDVRNEGISVPPGVQVIGSRGPRLRLIVPRDATLPVTAHWTQQLDPNDPDTPTCPGNVTTELPITPTKRSHALITQRAASLISFAVVPDPSAGDRSPMEISLRLAKKARFPSARAKARTMPVAMRPSEIRRYRRHIPKIEFATSPKLCRFYFLTCGPPLIEVYAGALAPRPPNRPITVRSLHSLAPLSALQPYKWVAPGGIRVTASPGAALTTRVTPALGYDIQVHQAGELVGRLRAAVRCGRERTRFGEFLPMCHVVKRKFG